MIVCFHVSNCYNKYASNASKCTKGEFQNTFYKIALFNPTLFTGTVTKIGIAVRLLLMDLAVRMSVRMPLTTVKLQFSTVPTV
jgi:hypothetical protein